MTKQTTVNQETGEVINIQDYQQEPSTDLVVFDPTKVEIDTDGKLPKSLTFQQRVEVMRFVQDAISGPSENIDNYLNCNIEVNWWMAHQCHVRNRSSGELVPANRVVCMMVSVNGKKKEPPVKLSFVSTAAYNFFTDIVENFFCRYQLPFPIPLKVQQVNTKSGGRTYNFTIPEFSE